MSSTVQTAFKCDCGVAACCRNVGDLLPSKDGVCNMLDLKTNRCSIYDTRPEICRVDAMYARHGASITSWEEWCEINEEACKPLISKELARLT